ncbi:aminotransferase class I and II protein [Ceratobasidium sp. AG-Ba]|nr:aminotransferase class I and II protein [Ceratobasidium sp. AG-Ba]
MAGQSELHKQMSTALSSRRERGILRRPHPDAFIPLPPNSHLHSQTALASLVDFSSNDYLSLATHEPLREHFLQCLHQAPQILGSGGSRLLDGTCPAHLELEHRLAHFFSSPTRPLTALLFGSGFDANAALFSSLPQPDDTILYDELVHASVHDGMRASRLPRTRLVAFKHNCVRDLTAKIQDALREMNGRGTIFVALEALYSMDGDLAPLVDICSAVETLVPTGRACIVVTKRIQPGSTDEVEGWSNILDYGAASMSGCIHLERPWQVVGRS